jgi:hypothetical protein
MTSSRKKTTTQKTRKENTEKQWLLFYTLLQTRSKESEISNTPLYGELNSTWFHHILPKSKYPELRFCPENIIIVTFDEHTEIESGKYFDEVEKRKQQIVENYNDLVESTKTYLTEFLNPIYEHAKHHTDFFKRN